MDHAGMISCAVKNFIFGKITVAEIVSMCTVVIAIMAKINFLAGVVDVSQPVLLYVLYALTGVALGRGPSFVHDLWIRLKELEKK